MNIMGWQFETLEHPTIAGRWVTVRRSRIGRLFKPSSRATRWEAWRDERRAEYLQGEVVYLLEFIRDQERSLHAARKSVSYWMEAATRENDALVLERASRKIQLLQLQRLLVACERRIGDEPMAVLPERLIRTGPTLLRQLRQAISTIEKETAAAQDQSSR